MTNELAKEIYEIAHLTGEFTLREAGAIFTDVVVSLREIQKAEVS